VDNGAHFIASEYIEGETLHWRIQHETPALKASLKIAIQIASALDAAHRAGIIHRDIKPENVIIRPDGLVKILDFGIAKLSEPLAVGGESSEEAATALKAEGTSPGMIIGTAHYMSPEQARGKSVDARSDIFSFGIVLYELLTGKRPFDGENAMDVMGAVLHKEPVPLNQLLPALPPELERIVNKMLRKDREQRYQTAKDLLIDLKDVRRELEFQDKQDRTVAAHTPALTAVTAPDSKSATSSAEFITQEVKKHKVGVVLGSLILLLIAFAAWFFFFRSPANAGPIDSIAVLPFQNKSSVADTEYLSDGLADSLIYRLSQLPNLKVSPTSSVFRYKGTDADPIKIGGELGVNAVLTGRIVQRGDNLTVSVELVDVRSNKLLWGEQYERKMSDLLATQREIATTITEKLQLKLSGVETTGITKHYTNNNEAYQLYLKGRYHFAKRTKEDVLKSIEYFRQAIKLDANFALAYARIAEAYNQMPNYPYLSPNEAFPQAKAAAQRALEIDPTLSEAHAALGNTLTSYDWNWTEAERSFKRSIELDPNSASAHYRYATEYLISVGRYDEALAEVTRALEIEPLDLNMLANLGRVYLYGRHPDKALEQAKRAHELEPNFVIGRLALGMVYNANSLYDDAIRLSESSLPTEPFNQHMLWVGGFAYAKTGRRREAEAIIRRFDDIAKTQYVIPSFVASIYGALGDKDKAFAELDTALEQRDSWLKWIKVDPMMDPLRDDSRFKGVVQRLNLPQ